MRPSLWIFALICALWVSPPVSAWAETSNEEVVSELKELRKALQAQNELIQKQQAKIEELERKISFSGASSVRAEPVEARTGSVNVSPSTGSGRPVGSAPGQIGAVLPEIGVVGDVVATSSEDDNDTEGNDRIAVRHVELVFGSNVDPYSRFDASLAFSDFENAGVEEAYLTRWDLPGDLTARFGRFFPKVGKQASIHRDSVPTVDEPLVIQRYFGSEGYFRTGADITRIFEWIGGWVLQPSFGVLEGGTGEGGTVFGSTRRRPTVYSHLKAYKDLNDSSSFELGATHLAGSRDADPKFEVNVFGLDATYLNHLTPIRKLLLQSEVFVQHRTENFAIDNTTGKTTKFDRHPWGAYVLADYRFAPRWSVGARADHVRLVETAGSRQYDQGLSAFLTFYQSEWTRWRLQFRHDERGPRETDNSVLFQGTFAIGTHKHKIQ